MWEPAKVVERDNAHILPVDRAVKPLFARKPVTNALFSE